ncbi:hypothetical protein ACRRTK_003055 [Alexandromys fortis]
MTNAMSASCGSLEAVLTKDGPFVLDPLHVISTFTDGSLDVYTWEERRLYLRKRYRLQNETHVGPTRAALRQPERSSLPAFLFKLNAGDSCSTSGVWRPGLRKLQFTPPLTPAIYEVALDKLSFPGTYHQCPAWT